MPIALNDAVERAKLSADESGLISQQTYDMLFNALLEKDRHSFVMALVDLGIITKVGRSEDIERINAILDIDPTCDEEDLYVIGHQLDIVEEFVKVANDYVIPTLIGAGPKPRPKNRDYQSFLPESPFVFPEEFTPADDEDQPSSLDYVENKYFDPNEFMKQPDLKTEQEPEQEVSKPLEEPKIDSPVFSPAEEPIEDFGPDWDQIKETLEKAGLSIDQKGMVTKFKQNLPGLYTQKIPLKPMPLEKMISLYENELQSYSGEKSKVESLQDILSSLGSDFSGMESDFQDLLGRFDSTLEGLEQFKYSEKSKDKAVRSIADGLKGIREYLGVVGPSVQDIKFGLSSRGQHIKDLQSQLDNYYQKQYSGFDDKTEVVEALRQVKELKDTNPEQFGKVVREIGTIAAKLKRLF